MSHPSDTQPRVSIVIPVYNQVDLLEKCLASLDRQEGVDLQVIVVDDQSPEDPSPVLARYPQVEVVRMERNSGYASANNAGFKLARGRYFMWLNSDTEIPPDGVRMMAEYLDAHPEAGGVTPQHRGNDGEVQRTCYRFPTLQTGYVWDSVLHLRRPDHPAVRSYQMLEWDHQSERWVEHAQTSCLMVRREAYEAAGGMDPNLFLFYNDTDVCCQMAKAGYPIWYLPQVEIRHHGGASVKTFDRAEAQVFGDRYRYYRKWFGWRGALAIRTALWSRVGYEAFVEFAHLNWRFAWRKVQRGLRLNRALVGSR